MTTQEIAIQWLTVDEMFAGQRIDNFLLHRLKGLPKSRLYRALRSGELRVNKKRITINYRVQAGDLIRIPPFRLSALVEKTYLPATVLRLVAEAIIYEDKNLIILNKPAGVAVHGGSGLHIGVIEALRHLRPTAKFLELVHRLDRDTTGCLMLAKKPSILKELQQLFVAKKITKIYLTVVKNPWQGAAQRVSQPLLKNTLQSGERIVRIHAEGKVSETVFSPLKVFSQASLMQVQPFTGRTHQIRVHAAYLNHPILGDEKYGRRNKEELNIKHLMLHAATLTFHLSSTGQDFALSACLPKHFLQLLKTFTIPKAFDL